MFESLPPDAADLMRVSEFRRRQRTAPAASQEDLSEDATQYSALNASLLQDLMRFRAERDEGRILLEVLAAALRHGRALQLHVQLQGRVFPLKIWPIERELQAPLPLSQLLALRLPDLQVLRVEPALDRSARIQDEADPGLVTLLRTAPLARLAWELALRGSRGVLLPEIGGLAAFRVVPGADLEPLRLAGSLAQAVGRLRREAAPLREISRWPGLDSELAARLLNGLYLQAALMVSRAHPSAIRED